MTDAMGEDINMASIRFPRSIYERLSTQRALLGLLLTYPNSILAEMAGMCGYDFLLLDCEHGLLNDQDCLQALQMAGTADIATMVRIARHDTQAVGRYLDMGADAIIVPNVSTADQARALARAMVYPPAGTRGFSASLHRATHYGLNLANHMTSPREGAYLLPIIESAVGVANVGGILATEGVDGVIVGPADLSADLDCAGDFSQPQYQQAMEQIQRAAASQGKLLGTAPHAGYPMGVLLDHGYRLFVISADVTLMREAMRAQVTQSKACL
jgi:4-hydroxy-2-oxoheptanedioate aldolase